MIASGGTPPRPPVKAVTAEATAAWRNNMQAMIAALAARSDAHEREIAALKAEAEARRQKEASGAMANAFFSFLGAAAMLVVRKSPPEKDLSKQARQTAVSSNVGPQMAVRPSSGVCRGNFAPRRLFAAPVTRACLQLRRMVAQAS
jgi:hypothetical protein